MEAVFTKKQKISLLLHYFIGYTFLYQILAAIIIITASNFIAISEDKIDLYTVILYALPVFLIMIITSKKVLNYNWKFLKVNKKEIIKDISIRFLITYGINMIIGILISSIINEGATNQLEVIEMVKKAPLFMGFMTVIFAPIVEEIIFREIIQKSISIKYNKKIGLFIASFIFGFVHLIPTIIIGNWIGLIYIIQYGALGLMLGIAYNKNNNLSSSILLHGLNNLVGYLLILLSMMVI